MCMKKHYSYNDVPDNRGMIEYLSDQQVFTDELVADSLKDYSFNEFTLEELGLPSAKQLLDSVLAIKNEVGVVGWRTHSGESKTYKGFSLTYNPDYFDKEVSIHHQTWGSNLLTQNYGKIKGLGAHTFIKNTYYDTYAFRKVPPSVDKNLSYFLEQFQFPIFRSRVAFFNMFLKPANSSGWHVDEPPAQLLRINIPLQTSPEHVLEIKDQDEFGNSLNLVKHLEVGKAYIWNTRIPHKVDISKPIFVQQDRIHLVIGMSPWIDYDPESDTYFKSKYYGMPLNEIVKNKYFIKSCKKATFLTGC